MNHNTKILLANLFVWAARIIKWSVLVIMAMLMTPPLVVIVKYASVRGALLFAGFLVGTTAVSAAIVYLVEKYHQAKKFIAETKLKNDTST